VDRFEKLKFYPEVFYYLGKIAKELDYELVMVTNQDGLGTESHPEENFWPVQNFIIECFENEKVTFSKIHIDNSFPHENKPTRKPKIGMLTEYLDAEKYDLANSFVIGDRITDVELAKNLNTKAIFIANEETLGQTELSSSVQDLEAFIALKTFTSF
jgi:imidazoleglycerol-phosphate dehydratase/histidinol-phosphatase